MQKYDPLKAPSPKSWNKLSENERLAVVMRYHEKAGDELPNLPLHASIHVVVENQVAMGRKLIAAETLTRLISEGLTRHQAVHAIGAVLNEFLFGALTGDSPQPTPEDYFANLRKLTAAQWQRMGETDAGESA
jgi:hypothetical protein